MTYIKDDIWQRNTSYCISYGAMPVCFILNATYDNLEEILRYDTITQAAYMFRYANLLVTSYCIRYGTISCIFYSERNL